MKDLKYFKALLEADDENTNSFDTASDAETEKKPEDSKDKPEEPKDEEKSNEEEFIKMFDDTSFIDAFKSSIKQYISEKLLDDDYNSFTVLPFIEIEFNDDTYGINVEFESAVSINIDDDGKVVEKDIPDVSDIKFKTPLMDDLTIIENQSDRETISVYILEAIDEIKNVSR